MCDYNALMLLSFQDGVENTALSCFVASGSIFDSIPQAEKRKSTVVYALNLITT